MTKRRKFLHIRRVIWTSKEIGISTKNWDRLNSGYYSGVMIDQKVANKKLFPGVFHIPAGKDREEMTEAGETMPWKGITLYIFKVEELIKE
jgi:hypothetical protein